MKSYSIILFVVLMFVKTPISYGQQYWGNSKAAFTKYLKRVYEVEHTEGCQVYEFNNTNILVTVVSVKQTQQMQRAGEIKALRTAGEFLRGAQTISVSKVETTKDGKIIGTPSDNIITSSVISIGKMEILSSFPNGERMVYVYFKRLDNE